MFNRSNMIKNFTLTRDKNMKSLTIRESRIYFYFKNHLIVVTVIWVLYLFKQLQVTTIWTISIALKTNWFLEDDPRREISKRRRDEKYVRSLLSNKHLFKLIRNYSCAQTDSILPLRTNSFHPITVRSEGSFRTLSSFKDTLLYVTNILV